MGDAKPHLDLDPTSVIAHTAAATARDLLQVWVESHVTDEDPEQWGEQLAAVANGILDQLEISNPDAGQLEGLEYVTALVGSLVNLVGRSLQVAQGIVQQQGEVTAKQIESEMKGDFVPALDVIFADALDPERTSELLRQFVQQNGLTY